MKFNQLVELFCEDILLDILCHMSIRLSVVQNLFIDYCFKRSYPLHGNEELILEILKDGDTYILLDRLHLNREDDSQTIPSLDDTTDDGSELEDVSNNKVCKIEVFCKHKKK